MCGIVGYVGPKLAQDVIYSGLERLEYRGYDSAGISVVQNNGKHSKVVTIKAAGKLVNLKSKVSELPNGVTLGVGHTRWATHGEANERNCHPHVSAGITIVHNGIIENFAELRRELGESRFQSETDSEVFAHLVADLRASGKSLAESVRAAFKRLEGNSAFVVIDRDTPDTIVAIRRGASPLVVGLGDGEALVASDVPALLAHTRDVFFLQENQFVVLTHDGAKVFGLDGKEEKVVVEHIEWSADAIDKMGFAHFMLKEVHEQPRALADTLRPWIIESKEKIKIHVDKMTSEDVVRAVQEARNVHIVACGTAFYAAMYGQDLLERYAKVSARAELAHEFRYREPHLRASDVGIVVSQSGETADTMAAVRMMRSKGMKVFCITNVRGSSIARECDGVFLMNAGIEICVASTKAFSAMLIVFAALSVGLGVAEGHIDSAAEKNWVRSFIELPELVASQLEDTSGVEAAAKKYQSMKGYLYLGRGSNYPIALEGALKLKELAYVHAEGFAAGELKHGPLALVEERMLIVAVAPEGEGELHQKSLSNIAEVKSRRGAVLGIGASGDNAFAQLSNHFLTVPRSQMPELNAILALIPLQLLAYFISVGLGCEIDQPRNLAKSVTVE